MECQAKRPIKKGEWFSLSDSDVESTQAEDRRAVNPAPAAAAFADSLSEEPRGTKRRR